MDRVRCVCGGTLLHADPRGIQTCTACGGTLDRGGLYLPDPRPARPPVEIYERAPDIAKVVTELDVEHLARVYLAQARKLQAMYLPPQDWAELPTYDELPGGHQGLLRAALAATIEEVLGPHKS